MDFLKIDKVSWVNQDDHQCLTVWSDSDQLVFSSLRKGRRSQGDQNPGLVDQLVFRVHHQKKCWRTMKTDDEKQLIKILVMIICSSTMKTSVLWRTTDELWIISSPSHDYETDDELWIIRWWLNSNSSDHHELIINYEWCLMMVDLDDCW